MPVHRLVVEPQPVGQRGAEVILTRDADRLPHVAPGLGRVLPGDQRRGEQLEHQLVKVVVRIGERLRDAHELRIVLGARARVGVGAELLRPGRRVERMVHQGAGEVVERREGRLLPQVVERRGGEDLRRVVLRVVRVRVGLPEHVPHRIHRLVAAVAGAGRVGVLAVLAVVEHRRRPAIDRVDAAADRRRSTPGSACRGAGCCCWSSSWRRRRASRRSRPAGCAPRSRRRRAAWAGRRTA